MKGKKQGISLITLVITIIVIIILAGAVILSMMQNNPVNKAKEAVFKTDIATYQEQVELYHLNETSKGMGNYERSSLNKTGEGLKEVIPSIKQADISKLKIELGNLVYIGTDETEKAWVNQLLGNPEYGVNAPALAQGMTPIKWNGTEWVNTTASDTAWYNYESKEWANAKTQDGSFWVWIPRYEYQITNPHTSTAEEIKVNFIKGTTVKSTAKYILHPAFTFGDDSLTGIWVAKFEATAREGVDNTTTGDNVTTKNVKILPNESSWRYITISNMFDVAKKMEIDETYGWGTSGNGIDTHLMKNVEWGAVAYLSNSKYGKNSEIWTNPYTESKDGKSNLKTGQAGATVSTQTTTSTYQYDTTNGMQASTTGNITGVYDMSGGAFEYTVAYVNNGHSNLTTYGSSIINAENKYKDIYKMGSSDTQQLNYEANAYKKGEAVYEVSNGIGNLSWYSDNSYMPYSSNPFFRRGGHSGNASSMGIFSSHLNEGSSTNNTGFRPILLVSALI